MTSNIQMQERPRRKQIPTRPQDDLEIARQEQTWPLPLRISAGGRLRKGVGEYERDLARLEHNQDPDLLEKLFWYQEYGSSRHTHAFRFPESDTFGTAVLRFRETLRQSSRSSTSFLQLCILNTTAASDQLISWPHRFLASVRGRLDELLVFPRWVIGIELEQAWGGLSGCACKSIEKSEQILDVEQLSLPEFRRQFLSHAFSLCRCRDWYTGFSSSIGGPMRRASIADYDSKKRDAKVADLGPRRCLTFHIDLPSKGRDQSSLVAKSQFAQCCRIFDRSTASFSFTWQRTAPRFRGSFDSFLWERYQRPPTNDYAEVFYQDDRTLPGPRRVLLTCSTTDERHGCSSMMDDFKSLLKPRRAEDPDIWPFMLLLQSSPRSDGYSLLPVFIVFQQIINDTANFMKEVSDELRMLSFSGRMDASVSKVQYLSHLDDCRESALMGVSHAFSIIKDLSSIVNRRRQENTSVSIEVEFLREKQSDMDFLIEQLDETLKDQIRGESIRMKENRMLLQCQQISTLYYLAVIFLPLLLITGMLSMNVGDPSFVFHSLRPQLHFPQPQISSASNRLARRQGLMTSVSATLSPSLAPLVNPMNNTSAEVASTPHIYVWPFSVFFGLAIALFMTSILLSISMPVAFRWGLRSFRRR